MSKGNGFEHGAGASTARAQAGDALGAIALAEGSIAEKVFLGIDASLPLPQVNAFGDPVTLEASDDVDALARRCDEAASAGERVTLIASARSLASARAALKTIAAQRL